MSRSTLAFSLILGAWISSTLFVAEAARGDVPPSVPTPVEDAQVAVHPVVGSAEIPAQAALEEGNRLFEEGRFDEAAAAYARGIDPERPNPTLIYNLATGLHHADRLTEAILWYRRGVQDDPWLEENLWLARRSLGSQTIEATGVHAWLKRHQTSLGVALIAWIWLASLLAVLLTAGRARAAIAAAALGTVLYLASVGMEQTAPKAVVLLQDCETPQGKLPAGTEAWAKKTDQGWSISGANEAICPLSALEPVNP